MKRFVLVIHMSSRRFNYRSQALLWLDGERRVGTDVLLNVCPRYGPLIRANMFWQKNTNRRSITVGKNDKQTYCLRLRLKMRGTVEPSKPVWSESYSLSSGRHSRFLCFIETKPTLVVNLFVLIQPTEATLWIKKTFLWWLLWLWGVKFN